MENPKLYISYAEDTSIANNEAVHNYVREAAEKDPSLLVYCTNYLKKLFETSDEKGVNALTKADVPDIVAVTDAAMQYGGKFGLTVVEKNRLSLYLVGASPRTFKLLSAQPKVYTDPKNERSKFIDRLWTDEADLAIYDGRHKIVRDFMRNIQRREMRKLVEATPVQYSVTKIFAQLESDEKISTRERGLLEKHFLCLDKGLTVNEMGLVRHFFTNSQTRIRRHVYNHQHGRDSRQPPFGHAADLVGRLVGMDTDGTVPMSRAEFAGRQATRGYIIDPGNDDKLLAQGLFWILSSPQAEPSFY
jgi:hypothetical protein